MDPELELLGWPADGPTLRLDHERFSYAGKFVMSNTGKIVAREASAAGTEPALLGAVAFNEDRTDPDTLWIRYVTVRTDRRGEGIGVSLARHLRAAAADEGYDTVRIAVNNPYAYHAMYKAGFGYTGRQTGIAELVLEAPRPESGEERRSLTDAGAAGTDGRSPTDADPETAAYRAGLEAFAGREDLSEAERAFVSRKRETTPPPDPMAGPATGPAHGPDSVTGPDQDPDSGGGN